MKNTLAVKYKWLLSYFFISILAILICNMSFWFYQSTFKQMLSESQMSSVAQVGRGIDSNLNILNQCAQAIISANLFDNGGNAEEETGALLLKYRSHIEEINKIVVVSGIVDRFYVYLPDEDRIISQNAVLPSASIYSAYHSQAQQPYEEWIEMLGRKNLSSYYVDYSLPTGGDSEQPFLFCVKGAETADGTPYTVVLMTRISSFWTEKYDYVKMNNLTIYENKEKILYKNRDFDLGTFQLGNDSDSYTNGETGERYIVLSANSGYTNWTYVFFVPYDLYWTPFNHIRNIILFTNAAGIVVCFALAYYFARKNYTPVQSILSIFDKTKSNNLNDFTYITDNIKSLIREKDQLETKNENLTQNVIIKRLLAGYIPYSAYAENLLSKNGIAFDKKYLMVALFRITDYSGLFPQGDSAGDQLPIESVIFIIINVAKDTLLTEYDAYHCSVDNDVSFIIKTDGSDMDRLRQSLCDLRDKLRELIYIETSVALSQKHSNPYELHLASGECLEVLKYQKMFSEPDAISYDAICNLAASYTYTSADETKIINAVTSGSFEQADALIDDIFEKNLRKKMSATAATMLIYDVVTTMFRLSDSVTLPELKEQVQLKLSDDSSIDSARENTRFAARLLCAYFSDKASKFKISGQITSIVKASYQNANLSVAEIGYKMNKTPQYVSKVFKNETGETLSAYIQQYRISVAKELLIQTNLSVKEIATNVGFTNSNSFISTFKNLEGVTPGQFKASRK